ncbi:MAG: YicC family protein [Deltaproteobacteria bacterium]|nr:YicC family protein [Deltaproteobacteria bacterium]
MKSMTGYGSGSATFPGGRVTVELRAVNHRFLELKMPLPREMLPFEQEFRTMIENNIKRGKLDMLFTTSGKPLRTYTVQPNLLLARAYQDAVQQVQREIGVKGTLDLAFLSAHPELFQVQEQQANGEPQAEAAKKALTAALSALERQRAREGKFLQRELQIRIATLDQIRRTVKARSSIVYENTRERLKDRINNVLQGLLPGVEIDQSRLLQEVATLAQRGDITEELVRLQSHLEALRSHCRSVEPVGKRIDFLLQEVQREVNTIGSKADDVEVRHLVVSAKEEVEKLREQVQNVE